MLLGVLHIKGTSRPHPLWAARQGSNRQKVCMKDVTGHPRFHHWHKNPSYQQGEAPPLGSNPYP